MHDIQTVKKDLVELECIEKELFKEKNKAIINFFNEEYGAGYSNDRTFELFSDLFSEDGDGDGYFDPCDLQLGWDEIRLLMHWQSIQEYMERQVIVSYALEKLVSDDKEQQSHSKGGLIFGDFAVEKAIENLQQIIDDANAAITRLENLKNIMSKYE